MKTFSTLVVAFMFLSSGVAFASTATTYMPVEEEHSPRSGDYMICVNNDVFGDCDNDWDARAERHFWNEWKGGVPTAVASVEGNVEVEEQILTLRRQLINLLQQLYAQLVS